MGAGTETTVWGLKQGYAVVNEGHLLFGIFLPKLFREELQEPVGGAGLLWSGKINNKGSIGLQHTKYLP